MSEILKSKEFTVLLTTISFLIAFIPYFFDIPVIETISHYTVSWATTISYFVAILVLYYTTRRNVTRFTRRTHGWIYGMVTLVLMYYLLVVGFAFGTEHFSFTFLFDSIYSSLQPMSNGIMFFALSSAGARAFRMRDKRSTVLLITAAIIILKNAPIGTVLVPGIQPIGTFIMDVIAAAGNRAFKIGVAIAGILMTIRVLLGKETAALGLGDE